MCHQTHEPRATAGTVHKGMAQWVMNSLMVKSEGATRKRAAARSEALPGSQGLKVENKHGDHGPPSSVDMPMLVRVTGTAG